MEGDTVLLWYRSMRNVIEEIGVVPKTVVKVSKPKLGRLSEHCGEEGR
jgi:hypothetical protein